ncbi:peptidylprolyl isomerase [bacterium]|nr:peptidylprolyl isomerase [bacterium]
MDRKSKLIKILSLCLIIACAPLCVIAGEYSEPVRLKKIDIKKYKIQTLIFITTSHPVQYTEEAEDIPPAIVINFDYPIEGVVKKIPFYQFYKKDPIKDIEARYKGGLISAIIITLHRKCNYEITKTGCFVTVKIDNKAHSLSEREIVKGKAEKEDKGAEIIKRLEDLENNNRELLSVIAGLNKKLDEKQVVKDGDAKKQEAKKVSSEIPKEEIKKEEPALVYSDRIAAIVNDQIITLSELNRMAVPIAENSKEDINEVRKRVLGQLIEKKILLQEAEKERIEISKERLRESEEQIIIAELINGNVNKKMYSVTEDEIEKFYEINKSRFYEPTKIKARNIFIKVNDLKNEDEWLKAEIRGRNILREIYKGEDFAELAKSSDDKESSSRGGDLGYFSQNEVIPEIGKAAFELKVGEASDLVKTPFGYIIIKVEDKKIGKCKDMEEVRVEIKNVLLQRKKDEALRQFIEGLKKEASVEIKIEIEPEKLGI